MTLTPYYDDPRSGITIYHGDCAEVLSTLAVGTVDLVVTSPPYNKAGLEGHIRKSHQRDAWKRRHITYGEHDDFMPEPAYQAQQVAILTQLHALCIEGGSLFYNHKPRIKDFVCRMPWEWLPLTPWHLRQEVIWDRQSLPNVDPIRFFASTERVYWMFKGAKPRYFNPEAAAYKEVWNLTPDYGNDHPAPFPLALASRCIIAGSRPGELVLDPYVGSGTTLRAAKDLGRRAIGIDLSEQNCEIAVKRLQQAVLALPA